MGNILDTIVFDKRKEVITSQEIVSTQELERIIEQKVYPNYSLTKSLASNIGIVAEFKRASPSKGAIRENAEVEEIVSGYSTHGAAGISVLTDKPYFKAQAEDFEKARNVTQKPLLRKEFIVDEYQILESKAIGANVVLLIASVLSKKEIQSFTRMAHSLQMEVLLELHEEEDLSKLSGEEDLIGINNRNLKTFEVNISHSIQLRKLLGNPSIPMLSESGLSKIEDVEILLKAGFRGFLMGEFFMKQTNPTEAFSMFNKKLTELTIN